MGKLKVLSGKEVCSILEKYGFSEVRRRGSHIVMQKKVADSTLLRYQYRIIQKYVLVRYDLLFVNQEFQKANLKHNHFVADNSAPHLNMMTE